MPQPGSRRGPPRSVTSTPISVRSARYWSASAALLDRLPDKTRRSAAEQRAADALLGASRESREAFLAAHVVRVYEALTDTLRRFVRVDDLVTQAAIEFPGLVPSTATLAAEAPRMLADKDGHEVDQGLFVAHVLANARCGMQLCHAMLLPHPDSAALVETFARTGHLDLGKTIVERHGASAIMNFYNPDYLNAEDADTVEAQELAVDVCSLDADSQVAVMRGGQDAHREVRRSARLQHRDQPHAPLPRQGAVHLVHGSRARLGQQGVPAGSRARTGRPRRSSGIPTRSSGSRPSTPSRSAAVVSTCSSQTSMSPRATPT